MTTSLSDAGASFADGTVITSAKNLGLRNRLINGNFGINQRGVSGTVVLTAGQYGHDRWKAGASGCTYTFATSNNITTITISAGSLQQVIEGLNLQSGTHVLSWSGTAQGKIDGGAYSASGVNGTATGGTNMTVEFNTGTLSQVQLEEGQLPTRFEQRPVGLETALCQRYYEIVELGIAATGASVVALSSNFSSAKRVTPTFTRLGAGLIAGTAPDLITTTTTGYYFQRAAASTGGLYSASAEL